MDAFVVQEDKEITGRNSETNFVPEIRQSDPLHNCFGLIIDFVSFYTLPSTVMHHPVHKSLRAAYSFYNVSNKTPWVELINDALIAAKNVCQFSYP